MNETNIENLLKQVDEITERIKNTYITDISFDYELLEYDVPLKNNVLEFLSRKKTNNVLINRGEDVTIATDELFDEIIHMLEQRKQIYSIIKKINDKQDMEIFEIQILQKQLSNLGRQKESIFDGTLGLFLLKTIIKDNRLKNAESNIFDINTFIKYISYLKTGKKDLWVFIRDNIKTYAKRDQFFRELTNPLAKQSPTFSNGSPSNIPKIKQNYGLTEEMEKTKERMVLQDWSGTLTSALTELDTVANKYLTSLPEPIIVNSNQAKIAIRNITDNIYNEENKFNKNIKAIGRNIRGLENAIRELRNSAGDAHLSKAIVDKNVSLLAAEVTSSLIKFINSKINE